MTTGLPPSPGGPAQPVEHWPVTVAGFPAPLHRTAFFWARPDEVLVVSLTRGGQYYHLFARHETPARLQQVLATLPWQKP